MAPTGLFVSHKWEMKDRVESWGKPRFLVWPWSGWLWGWELHGGGRFPREVSPGLHAQEELAHQRHASAAFSMELLCSVMDSFLPVSQDSPSHAPHLFVLSHERFVFLFPMLSALSRGLKLLWFAHS